MKQRTLLREVSIKGNALHTGDAVHMIFKPAPVNHGIVFKRMDLHGHPEIKPRVDLVTDLVRATTIQQGHAKIHTVEHVLSALSGCGVDNLLIEMDAGEPPIMDGSAREFVKMIQQGEPVEQDAEREYFTLTEPVSVSRGNSSIIALPYDGLKITCTSADDRGTHTQHLSLTIDPDVYVTQVAAARTVQRERLAHLDARGKLTAVESDPAAGLLADRARNAAAMLPEATALVVAGGVAANQAVRAALAEATALPLLAPPLRLCGDNAVMVAWAGLERLRAGQRDAMGLAPRPRWPLNELAPPA